MKPEDLKKRIDLVAVKKMIDEYELATRSRKREKIYYRCVLYYYLRNHLKHYSLARISSFFGRDHATALNAIKLFKTLNEHLEMYPDFKQIIDDVNSKIFIYGNSDLTPLELRIVMTKSTSELLAIKKEIINRVN